jgi:hypothetical protein
MGLDEIIMSIRVVAKVSFKRARISARDYCFVNMSVGGDSEVKGKTGSPAVEGSERIHKEKFIIDCDAIDRPA